MRWTSSPGAGRRAVVLAWLGALLVLGAASAVELLDADSKPIPGFSREECDVVTGDSLRHVVTWKGNADVSALQGCPVQVRFYLRKGDLYAFQFI